jgi:hypothetical protein
MKRFIFSFYALALSAMPFIASAQNSELTNPLGTTDVRLIIANIINGALSISGSIALLMFIYGGFLWMTAAGRPEPVDKGKKILIWATLGIIVIASAFVVTNAIFNAVLTGDVSGGVPVE